MNGSGEVVEAGPLSRWQVGDGSGGFVDCAGAGCVPRGELWDVRKQEFDGGEFKLDRSQAGVLEVKIRV